MQLRETSFNLIKKGVGDHKGGVKGWLGAGGTRVRGYGWIEG